MRKIANIIIVMMVISFILWGIININIINTASLSKGTDGVSSVSQDDYKELKDEFGQDFLGLLEDDCEVKIHDEHGSYKLEFYGKYYNIDAIGSKLRSLGIIKEKGNWVFNKISDGVEYFYEKVSNKISG